MRSGGMGTGNRGEAFTLHVTTRLCSQWLSTMINCLHLIQRFRVRHGLSCVIGLVWPVGAGCYSQAELPMPLSKPLYFLRAAKPTTVHFLFGKPEIIRRLPLCKDENCSWKLNALCIIQFGPNNCERMQATPIRARSGRHAEKDRSH